MTRLLLCALLLTGCAAESRAEKCEAFGRTADRLAAEFDAAKTDAEGQARRRVLAQFYVQDETGCATAEDKARAQVVIDNLMPR